MLCAPFQKYRSLCPPDAPNDAFYLQPPRSMTTSCWYSRKPLGHNTLSKTVSRLCKAAGIEGYKTNHSLRATSTSQLYHSDVDEQMVMERKGHRSIEGVRSYKRTSEGQREALSDVLNRKAPRIGDTSNTVPFSGTFPQSTTPTTPQNIKSNYTDAGGLGISTPTFSNCIVNFYLHPEYNS